MKFWRYALSVRIALILILAITGVATAVDKIYIDIYGPFIRKIAIAIPKFKSIKADTQDDKISEQIISVISSDLTISGLFEILDPASFIEDPRKGSFYREEIDFRDWSVIGAECLLKGLIERMNTSKKSLDLEMRLYDVGQAKMVLGRRYTADDSSLRRVAHHFSNEILRYFTGEDGPFLTKIAFLLSGKNGKDIYTMDYDGFNIKQITSDGGIKLSLSWSPDANKIAFISMKDGKTRLFVKHLILNRQWNVSIGAENYLTPSWSPDGNRLIFSASRDGNYDIYISNADGSNPVRLTDHWSVDLSPSFSPDGKYITFVSDRSGTPQVYIMNSDGSNIRRLTFQGSYNAQPSWSPRGDRIVFVSLSNGNNFDIFTINPDGSGLQKLTSSSGSNESPSWSPDGRLIAFSSTRDGKSQIFIMNANGANQKRITNVKSAATNPSWSPRFEK